MSISTRKVYVGYGFAITKYDSGILEVDIPKNTFDQGQFQTFLTDLQEANNLIKSDVSYRSEAMILIKQRLKLQAVKLIKETTGYGLKESKEIADALELELKELELKQQENGRVES